MAETYYLVTELPTEFGIDLSQELKEYATQVMSAEQANKLINSIYGLYMNYRIAFPMTDDITKKEYSKKLLSYIDTSIQQILNEFSPYYLEMIKAYEKEYDYATGITRTTTSNSMNVDLPNKVIDSNDIYKYPSSADKGSVTTTDNSHFLILKRQYMNQIRDLYREFASRFSDLFLHIYVKEDFEI
jgi:hypothetical protein